jgi:hypothetical protein
MLADTMSGRVEKSRSQKTENSARCAAQAKFIELNGFESVPCSLCARRGSRCWVSNDASRCSACWLAKRPCDSPRESLSELR